jgi:toxin ParE1/3/4
MTEIIISPGAESDLAEITDHYLREAGVEVTISFLAAWRRCTRHLAEHPESGSPRLAEKLEMSQLRLWPVRGFPHIAAYTITADVVTIERVLHSARDIPATLRT